MTSAPYMHDNICAQMCTHLDTRYELRGAAHFSTIVYERRGISQTHDPVNLHKQGAALNVGSFGLQPQARTANWKNHMNQSLFGTPLSAKPP